MNRGNSSSSSRAKAGALGKTASNLLRCEAAIEVAGRGSALVSARDLSTGDKPAWYTPELAILLSDLREGIFRSSGSPKSVKAAIQKLFKWWAAQSLPAVDTVEAIRPYRQLAAFCGLLVSTDLLKGVLNEPYPKWVENLVNAEIEHMIGEAHASLRKQFDQQQSQPFEIVSDTYQVNREQVGGLPHKQAGDTASEPRQPATVAADGTDRCGKTRKGDPTLLAGKLAVNFKTAEQYLGIKERQRQDLVTKEVLVVNGQGSNRKISSESLKSYLPPENPQ
jgi:hypothetical protein